MQFKPTAKNVVIKLKAPETTTKSGIILQQEMSNKNITIGEILDKGPDANQAIIGDTAYVSKFAIGDVAPKEGDLIIVDESDILLMVGK